MKQIKDDNRGLSLIEVLIAMVILAIVITPILHSFVTTATANTKAKNMHRATVLAQSVMEGLKSGSDQDKLADIAVQFNYPDKNNNWKLIEKSMVSTGTTYRVAEIREDASGAMKAAVKREHYEATASDPDAAMKNDPLHASVYYKSDGITYVSMPSANDKYYFAMNDLTMDDHVYDVLVKMDAGTVRAQTFNNVDMAKLPVMEENQDAVCIQYEDYTKDALIACDAKVGTTQYDIKKLTREIIIEVNYTDTPGIGKRTVVTATYRYRNKTNSSLSYEHKVTCYDSSQTGNLVRSIYLYYTPLYTSTNKADDVIRYINNDNYPVTLNIFKQKTNYAGATANPDGTEPPELALKDALAEDTSADNEKNYKMRLIINADNVANFSDLKTTFYTNLFMNIADPAQTSGTESDVQFKNVLNTKTVTLPTSGLADKEATDRVYDVEVTVYKDNAFSLNADGTATFNISEDKKLASLTGSLLE